MRRRLRSITTTSTTAISSSNKASFVMVLMGDFDEKLQVPTDFLKHFNGKLPGKSTVRGPNGRTRTIKMKRDGDDLYFFKGWPEFVDEHSLEFGDFLIFEYKGSSKFKVKIYGQTGIEKDLRAYSAEPSLEVKEHGTDEEAAYEGGYHVQRKSAMEVERIGRSRARKPALPINTNHPYFISTWPKSTTCYPRIPRDFARKYGLNTETGIVLRDHDGRSWPVKFSHNKDGRISMTKGWRQISAGNKLARGAKCLFQLISQTKGNQIMNVRVLGGAEIDKRDWALQSNRKRIHHLGSKLEVGSFKRGITMDCVTASAKERAIKEANGFQSKYPVCKIIMHPTYVGKWGAVNIPAQFAKTYLGDRNQMAILRISDGRVWHVGYRTSSSSSSYMAIISKGWNKFKVDNQLKEGDVCLFELVDRDNLEMHVTICQVTPNVN
ncbi:putative B3 domain-containing protein Os03g0621600 [Papaver somniferum]|uniref:putative B3 domain-containing protein Os03g0621600 n=1 Tax=Papaver somniferum TaxID=3469 RepID=UPI000E6F571A|nr:putative B3 domain-containing protein Os03g0621600 [Papaver somniferum]